MVAPLSALVGVQICREIGDRKVYCERQNTVGLRIGLSAYFTRMHIIIRSLGFEEQQATRINAVKQYRA